MILPSTSTSLAAVRRQRQRKALHAFPECLDNPLALIEAIMSLPARTRTDALLLLLEDESLLEELLDAWETPPTNLQRFLQSG